MKKNISINISGIIFHIEEDGYESLRRYLDSIHRYFSSFEDSTEIMADIESRIAEIFLSKLNEGKQIITAEDVNSLITTMGSVSDFKAAEEQEVNTEPRNTTYTETADQTFTAGSATSYTYTAPKQLVRDQLRKILGGVCAGIGNYMNIDPIWVRLLFAVLALAWGFTIFIYLILWVVLPGAYDLKEVEVGKKMYRDPERKVLGGVSGGVASFLNIDILAVRIIFIVLAVAGGLGLFVYIILWVILPEARTLTERMQMQGEPVTLSNIESNIKKNQTLDPNPNETPLTKLLLFPFRLLSVLIEALAKVLGPLVEVLRVAIGILIVLVGISLAMATIVFAGVAVGIFSASLFTNDLQVNGEAFSVPLEAFSRAFPGWVAVAGFVSSLIPAIFIILLGVSIIARRIVFGPAVGWSLFVLFFFCSAALAVGIPKIIYSFKENANYKIETRYNPTGKNISFKVNEVGLDDYDGTDLKLRGHDEADLKLVQVFSAQGSSRQKAIENAKMVQYNVVMQDSVLIFDSNIMFKEDAVFRAQHLDMTLYIPYNKPFVMDESFSRYISDYIDYEYLDGYTWQMTQQGLKCITCPDFKQDDEEQSDLSDFDQLEIRGIFNVQINRGDNYAVEINGPEKEKSKYTISRNGETLSIDYEGQKNFNWDMNLDKTMRNDVTITITMPSIEKLDATGYGSINFDVFSIDDMQLDLRGPIKVTGELMADEVIINLNGKSEVLLKGQANNLNAELELASELNAFDFEVKDAIVKVNGASNADVNVTETLEMEEGLASDIDFKGSPEVLRQN